MGFRGRVVANAHNNNNNACDAAGEHTRFCGARAAAPCGSASSGSLSIASNYGSENVDESYVFDVAKYGYKQDSRDNNTNISNDAQKQEKQREVSPK